MYFWSGNSSGHDFQLRNMSFWNPGKTATAQQRGGKRDLDSQRCQRRNLVINNTKSFTSKEQTKGTNRKLKQRI